VKLSKKQTIAIDYLEDDVTQELLFGGSAGGGKSFLGCYWQLKQRLKYPGTRGLIGRSKLKTLKETTLQSFFKVCKVQGVKPNVHFKYNSQSGVITFFNGSEILLKDLFSYPSDPNFDELGSLEITDAFIDEANQISSKAKQIVRSRIRHNLKENGLTPKLLMTCNPAKNWTYSEFYKPSLSGMLPDNKKFIQSLVTDNPDIDPSYIDNLKQLDRVSRERLLYGNWDYDDDPSALCDHDAITDIFTNDQAKRGGKYISADLAMQGRDKFIAGSWDGLVCTIEIDQDKSTGRSIELSLKQLKTDKGVGNSNIVADSDGLGNYIESYVTNIKAFHGNKKANDDQYANIKSECGFKLAELINQRKMKIVCTPEQQELITKEISICLKRDKIDADNQKKRLISKEKMKDLLGNSPDYMDMLIMRMIFEVKKEFSVFL
jgi:hypothetical protein